jgi:hypothetical protein
MEVYVEIVNYDTGEVVSRMGPMSEHKAGRVEDGANINLDHENYFTRIVTEDEDGEGKAQANSR